MILIFALMVSLSRVMLSAHWLSDVLGSIAIAFVALNAINEKVFKNILFESRSCKIFFVLSHWRSMDLYNFNRINLLNMNIDLLFSEWVYNFIF